MDNLKNQNTTTPVHFMNMAGLLGICIALIVAFYYQLVKSELPCPLCLLQRVGLIIAGCGFLFNLCISVKNMHLGMVIIGGIITGVIATRQVLLHIAPGDAGYGSAFLGLHFYTWALVSSVLIIIAATVILFMSDLNIALRPLGIGALPGRIVSGLFVLLIAANLISTLLECGTGQCADNPVRYELLSL